MRELYQRLSTVNKVGLIGAFLGFLAGMAIIIIVDPYPGVLVVALAVALVAFCFWFFFRGEFRRAKVLRSGLPATATILEVRSTGVTVNEVYPEIELLLEVHRKGSESYQARARCLIDQVAIPEYRPGNEIPVTIDARDKNKVAVGSPTRGDSGG
jgi:hypothetical protein